MKPILFEKDATDFTGLGICHLQDAISCIVTEERNGAFELELVYPVSGANYSEIAEDRIIAVKARENGTRQGFRIYRITATLTGEVTINARHISYQLNFVPVGVTSGTGTAQNMMAALKSAALEPCPFTFESDISGTQAYSFAAPVALRTALGGMEGSVLDLCGGEYEWDNWTVKLHASRGSDKGARIAYGKNMTALQRSVDIGDLITGVSAFWAGQNDSGVDVIVYSNPRVVTNGNQDLYSHHRTIVLDVSAEFETVPTQAQVTAYATTYLAATTLAQVSEAVTVDFVPLWQTQEYAGSFEEHIDLCDTVTVVYKELGVSVKKKVTKTVYDVILNRYESIELGGEDNIADTITSLSSAVSDTSNLASEVAKLAAAMANNKYTTRVVSGITWHIVEHNDGFVAMWATLTSMSFSCTTAGNGVYYSPSTNVNLPVTLSSGNLFGAGNQLSTVVNTAVSSTIASFRVMTATSRTVQGPNICVIGHK